MTVQEPKDILEKAFRFHLSSQSFRFWYVKTKVHPQRCLVYAKKQYPEKFENFFESCFETMWTGQLDISKPENLLVAARKVFDDTQAKEVVQGGNDPEIKKALTDNTEYAVKELGAFGCPWFWVHDGKGNAEPFFGSDRFHFMWDYLDIPHRDLELVARSSKI
ncbi:hypothetical protein LOZ52_000103 [Ophidiomyces ophidiicola]|nr:hypothetical protein LOZ60_001374 [Ophidiomyces ophidiicola]KAI1963139.1 hypothetical protein LOZ59_001921 [Ophidiomyces ophidiicola]KAI2147262.1 hypothetical protein LOZ28_000300 [Ophidiomyces ophidiicola]KAI2225881.1 hypothetical protein LOZ15_000276 [Ophidiomyces ophidiicola]KAI2235957.1 hypothetical protein LOZ13_004781 [Ophidiomyces ophidiicola]